MIGWLTMPFASLSHSANHSQCAKAVDAVRYLAHEGLPPSIVTFR